MHKRLRLTLNLSVLIGSVCFFSISVNADDRSWRPTETVDYIVQAGVGGGSDILARLLVQIIGELDVEPIRFSIENRAGGAGTIAYNFIHRQEGNPHYLGGVGVSFFTSPLLSGSDIDYSSFTPLAALAYSPYILVVSDQSKIEDISDIGHLDAVTSGTPTAVSDPTLLSYLLAQHEETEMRVVPFDGSGEVVSAVLGDHIELFFASPSEVMEQIQAGTLRPLAVTSSQRIEQLPDVPTFTELGYPIEHVQLRGIVAPPGISQDAVDFWEDTFRKVAESPMWKELYIDRFGEVPIFMGSDEFGQKMEETNLMYEELMRETSLID